MNVLYLLSLDRTAELVFWGALVQVGAFYMQRPHHETLTEWGIENRGYRFLALLGLLAGLLAYATTGYVWYRVGFVPAVVALCVMFAIPVAVSTIDVWWIRSPAEKMVWACVPLTILSFALMVRALLAIA